MRRSDRHLLDHRAEAIARGQSSTDSVADRFFEDVRDLVVQAGESCHPDSRYAAALARIAREQLVRGTATRSASPLPVPHAWRYRSALLALTGSITFWVVLSTVTAAVAGGVLAASGALPAGIEKAADAIIRSVGADATSLMGAPGPADETPDPEQDAADASLEHEYDGDGGSEGTPPGSPETTGTHPGLPAHASDTAQDVRKTIDATPPSERGREFGKAVSKAASEGKAGGMRSSDVADDDGDLEVRTED